MTGFREKLIETSVCSRTNAPSVSSINRLLRSRGLNGSAVVDSTNTSKAGMLQPVVVFLTVTVVRCLEALCGVTLR